MLDWIILTLLVGGVIAVALFLYPYPIQWGDEPGRDRAGRLTPSPAPRSAGDPAALLIRATGPAKESASERSREPAL